MPTPPRTARRAAHHPHPRPTPQIPTSLGTQPQTVDTWAGEVGTKGAGYQGRQVPREVGTHGWETVPAPRRSLWAGVHTMSSQKDGCELAAHALIHVEQARRGMHATDQLHSLGLTALQGSHTDMKQDA